MQLNKWNNLFTLPIFTECWVSGYTILAPKHVHIYIPICTPMHMYSHTCPYRSMFVHTDTCTHVCRVTQCTHTHPGGYTLHRLRRSDISYSVDVFRSQKFAQVALAKADPLGFMDADSSQLCALAPSTPAKQQPYLLSFPESTRDLPRGVLSQNLLLQRDRSHLSDT